MSSIAIAQQRSVAGQVRRTAGRLASHAVLAFFVVIIVYPVVWMVFSSLKTPTELMENIWGLPKAMAWDNYRAAWRTAELGRAIVNSIVVSAATVVLVITLASPAAYALARLRFRFATAIFLLFVLTMQAPRPVIPLYVMMVHLHLTDSYVALILPLVAGGIPLSIFVFRAFFLSIPRELEEASIVDGSTRMGAFLRVVMPLSLPAVATVAILQFLASWNEYFLALILIRSPEMRTVPLAIQVFFYDWGRSEWAQVFAALTVGSVPMIVVYVLMQRWFIRGLTAGAVRG